MKKREIKTANYCALFNLIQEKFRIEVNKKHTIYYPKQNMFI